MAAEEGWDQELGRRQPNMMRRARQQRPRWGVMSRASNERRAQERAKGKAAREWAAERGFARCLREGGRREETGDEPVTIATSDIYSIYIYIYRTPLWLFNGSLLHGEVDSRAVPPGLLG